MQLKSILTPERTFCGVQGGSKKRIFEAVSDLIAQDLPYINADELFTNLLARERLGSTGLGYGIAIPHCRLQNCVSSAATLVKLDKPIDFDAIDGNPVDLLCVLIVPQEESQVHLEILAGLAELFSQDAFRRKLRSAQNTTSLYQLAVNFPD